MNKIKVSFDFDETLDREDVQKYCRELQSKGIEVYVTTSRCDEKYFPQSSNRDLFDTLDNLNIKNDKLFLCNYYDKYEIIGDLGFVWYLDDSQDEIDLLNEHTDIKGIDIKKDDWKELCESYLGNNI